MQPKPRLLRRLTASAPPLAVIGAAVILAAVVAGMALFNLDRDKEYMSRILLEKGAVLIKSFEAGARTGMRGGFGTGIRLQHLLAEMSEEPGIFYIAVTDETGRILAHTDVTRLGSAFVSPAEMAGLAPGPDEQWRVSQEEGSGRRAFMVYRRFTPAQAGAGFRGGRGPGFGRMAGPGPDPAPGRGQGHRQGAAQEPGFLCTDDCDAAGQPKDISGTAMAIFVGLDVAPFEAARSADLRNTLTVAGVLLVLGVTGVVWLFWMQSYRAQKKLLTHTRALASEVVSGMPAGLMLLGPDGKVAMVNAAAERLAGVGEAALVGRPAEEVLPAAVLATDAPSDEREMDVRFFGGPPVALGVAVSDVAAEDGVNVGRLVLLRDLREVRRLEAEVRRREKLAAVGSLAAGVAHEIRNPLSSIRGYAAYFGGKFEKGSEDRQAAEVMVREVDRLNRVISELIAYARPSDLTLKPVSLSDLAEHAARLVRPDALKRGVAVDLAGVTPGPLVTADPDRLSQALLNLCLNAVQAMEGGGTLSLRTGKDEDGRAFLEVADTGPGIDEDNLTKIFDPYFTTKARGTGLGLPLAHKIVAAHGGTLAAGNRPDQGAVFTVLLPPTPQEDTDGKDHAGQRARG